MAEPGRRSLSGLLAALLGAGWLVAFFHAVLTPSGVLSNRDLPLFHLPLRLSLRALARLGPPTWNPWLHGGQPVLSNPNYAAFYPPTWLGSLVPPAYALSLLAAGHMALAFAGAWRLGRRLTGNAGGAALLAVGFSGCGAFLSLLNSFSGFCGLAWLPWILDAACGLLDRAAGPGRSASGSWLPRAFLLGILVALQFLCSEPVQSLATGLALLAFAVTASGRRVAAGGRLAAAALISALLAAVQILPTLGRLADSPRAHGLQAAAAGLWSMPPARAVEILFPRFFGDSGRDLAGLSFGWDLYDRGFPYVASLYPSLLLALLGVVALLRWPIPWRAAWGLTLAATFFLALGRHNPLYDGLRAALPPLAVVRYPEKFAVLGVVALCFAGALGWSWLLGERAAGRARQADFPIALAVLVLALAATVALALTFSPSLAPWYVRVHNAPGLSPDELAAASRFLIREGWWAVGTAAAVTALLALVRWPRPSRRLLEALALTLVAADLWRYGRGLVRVIPARAYAVPPPLAASLLPPRDRLYLEEQGEGPEIFVRTPEAIADLTYAHLARLEPYSGLLWGFSHVLHSDYDLMLTGSARRALKTVREDAGDRELSWRFLGAWNAGTLLLRKDLSTWAREVARDRAALPIAPVANPYRLDRFRFVPSVTLHPGAEEALAAARAERYRLDRREHLVRPGRAGETLDYPRGARLLGLEDRASRVRAGYRAAGGACFVMAATYDRGWSAAVDGRPAAVYPTAAGQMAVLVPAGEHRLELEYRDRLLAPGAALSLTTLALGALLALASRRKPIP
jgi:hypothetical protein